jgi:hypothetical protein
MDDETAEELLELRKKTDHVEIGDEIDPLDPNRRNGKDE